MSGQSLQQVESDSFELGVSCRNFRFLAEKQFLVVDKFCRRDVTCSLPSQSRRCSSVCNRNGRGLVLDKIEFVLGSCFSC